MLQQVSWTNFIFYFKKFVLKQGKKKEKNQGNTALSRSSVGDIVMREQLFEKEGKKALITLKIINITEDGDTEMIYDNVEIIDCVPLQ